MTARRRAASITPVLLSCIITALARGQEQKTEPPPSPTHRFLSAFRAGESETLKVLAAEPRDSPIEFVERMFGVHLMGRKLDPPRNKDALDAAEEYARLATVRDGGRRLPELVSSWRTYTPADLDRESRLVTALGEAGRQADSGNFVEALEAVEGVRDDLASSPASSLTALRLRAHEAYCAGTLGRRAEAKEIYEVLLARYEQWEATHEVALRLYEIGACATDTAEFATAITASRRARELFLKLGWKGHAARALSAVAIGLGGMGERDEALAQWDALLEEARSLGDPGILANTLANLGLVLQATERADESLGLLLEAGRLFEAAGDGRSTALNLSNLGSLHRKRGEHPAAREDFARALEIARKMRMDTGSILRELAKEHYWCGEYATALEVAQEARISLVATQRIHDAADVHELTGLILLSLGRAEEGKRCLLEAHDEHLRYQSHAGTCLKNLAFACTCLGQGTEALDYAHRALEVLGSLGDRMEEAESLRVLGYVLSNLGERERAVTLLRRSARILESVDLAPNLRQVRFALARCLLDGGREAEAGEILDLAKEDSEDRGAARDDEYYLDILRARLDVGSGDPQSARGRLERIVATETESGFREPRLLARAELGRMYLSGGEHEAARTAFEAALADVESLGSRAQTAAIRSDLARALLAAGDASGALEAAHLALDDQELVVRGLSDIETPLARRDSRVSADIGLAAALALRRTGPEHHLRACVEAFRFIEAGRARFLSHDLFNRASLLEAFVTAPSAQAETSARRTLDAAERRLASLRSRSRPGGPGAAEALAAARTEVDAAARAYEEAVATIRRESRRVGAVAWPEPASLTALQAGLPSGTAILLFHITEDAVVALAADAARAELAWLGEARVIREKAENYVRFVSSGAGSSEPELAATLYDVLVRPVEAIVADATTLLVSPDGPLAFVPFEALLKRDSGGQARLLERTTVTYVPSSSVWDALRTAAGTAAPGVGLVGLGDPHYPGEDAGPAAGPVPETEPPTRDQGRLRRIPASGDEVRAIAGFFPKEHRTLLLRGEATRSGIESALRSPSDRLASVHLACHGRLDSARPRRSGLVLSGGELLGLDDILRLRLDSDLVVLSACESSRGQELPGEGVLGLVRSVFFAGAQRVVVVNWRVEDSATMEFMKRFYERIFRDGLRPTAALRATKIDSCRGGAKTCHPHFWAAFVLWGVAE